MTPARTLPDGMSDETRDAVGKMTELEKRALEAAAKVLENYGTSIMMPWDATLDDCDDGLFHGLRLSCAAYRNCFQVAFVDWMSKFLDHKKIGFELTPDQGVAAYHHFTNGVDPIASVSAIQEGRTL